MNSELDYAHGVHKISEKLSYQNPDLTVTEMSPDILVTGATGFIGARLIFHLVNQGHHVKGMSRHNIPDTPGVTYVQADVFEQGQLENAMKGIKVAFYLLHSMEGSKNHWKEFASRERIQARNFLKAATKAKVSRIIYLGGLVNDKKDRRNCRSFFRCHHFTYAIRSSPMRG